MSTSHDWIYCAEKDTSLDYDCQTRPLMNVFLVLSILVCLCLRKSTRIQKWVLANEERMQEQTDEEEGLMQSW
ncbi:uncharacterized protein EV154DRAFT_561040 [Mucor mucedo]|uniref:uncharacterized protein n=1 Tax=Mucor mucedo TaxID=29922 RepID=UPI0022210667|nr:uncharacterized protein EV154DRAFT_561040 [Mucor mucedo]KAI7893767.1 hypothetical protein EV154DRAFT_561040 [Mucor mucedo]